MKLETLLKTFEYRITDGAEYLWKCYPNARYLSLSSEHAEVSFLYSTVDQTVYEVKVDAAPGVDAVDVLVYRWMNPDWKEAHDSESVKRGYDPDIAFDDVKWVDLDVEDDFLSKARNMFDGKFDFDKRVQVELDLPDDLILFIAKQAHKLDITFNQYIGQLLEHELPKLAEDIKNDKLPAMDWTDGLPVGTSGQYCTTEGWIDEEEYQARFLNKKDDDNG